MLLPVIGIIQVGLQARADRYNLPATDRSHYGSGVGRYVISPRFGARARIVVLVPGRRWQ